MEVRTNELSEANRQLQMREAQLQYAAHHDPLTGLGNRRHLMEFAESALDDARRHGNSMALLLIDLDHFKPINDTHGHDAGRLRPAERGPAAAPLRAHRDCVARLGGDEFAVLVGGSNAEQHARDIAERLLRELAKPVEFAKQWLVITPSIGVALFPGDALQFGKLYKAADQALYRVKGAGRAGYAMAADDERETAPALPGRPPWHRSVSPESVAVASRNPSRDLAQKLVAKGAAGTGDLVHDNPAPHNSTGSPTRASGRSERSTASMSIETRPARVARRPRPVPESRLARYADSRRRSRN